MTVDVHVDSDWVKGPERKSTSGCMMMFDGTAVKHITYAVVTEAAEGLGMQSMMTDLGLSARVRVWTDCNAAKAIAWREDLERPDTLNWNTHGYRWRQNQEECR